MNNPYAIIITLTCLLGAVPIPAPGQDREPETQELELKLEDARQRLQAAAREVAELSGQLAGDEVIRFRDRIRIDHRRAMLGINIADVEGETAYEGVKVLGVTPGGPAEAAGIKSGDVITAVNGDSLLTDPNERPTRMLIEKMQDVEPGEEVILEFSRGNTTRTATVTAEEFHKRLYSFAFGDDPGAMQSFQFNPQIELIPGIEDWSRRKILLRRWGDLELVTLTPGLGEYFGVEEGLLVVRAPKDAELKLQDGDVIVGIGGRQPSSPSHAMRILRSYQAGETLVLDIVRKNRTQKLEVSVPEDRLSNRQRPETSPTRLRMPRNLPAPVGT